MFLLLLLLAVVKERLRALRGEVHREGARALAALGAAGPPPNGGNGVIRGTTRRRHAANQLLMLQNPHRHQCRACCRGRGPGWGAGGCRKPGNCTHGRCHGETNLAQQEPRRAASVQNSPSTPLAPHVRYKTLPVHPKWLDLALFLRAGRVLSRSHHQEAEQGEFCTEHEAELWLANRTPGPTCVEGAGGTGVEGVGGTGVEGTGGLRGTEPGQCRWAVARPIHGAGGRRQDPAQTNFARNFRRSFFETAQKRCNSNEVISMFEQVTRELRAKLLRRRQDHAQPNVACNSPTTRTNTNSKTAEYQRLDFNT